MKLREAQWRRYYRIPSKLPMMHARFTASETWQAQQQVLDMDLHRMPPMRKDNVTKIILRFAATSPYAGYTQGNLYLVYALGLVFSDERSIFWAFAHMVQRLHRYGPTTPYGTRIVPDWVLSHAPELDRDLWDLIIRFRWLYVMFGQTMAHGLLDVWDYCLKGEMHMFSLCAALLMRGSLLDCSQCESNLERANLIIGSTVDSEEEVAQLISQAQLLLQCGGRSATSTGRPPRRRLLALKRPAPGPTATPTWSTS